MPYLDGNKKKIRGWKREITKLNDRKTSFSSGCRSVSLL